MSGDRRCGVSLTIRKDRYGGLRRVKIMRGLSKMAAENKPPLK